MKAAVHRRFGSPDVVTVDDVPTPVPRDDAVYVVTGPEALGYADVAARVSAVFARQVDYENQSAKRARELMQASGMGRWEADGEIELFEWVRHGGADTVTDTVRAVTGEDPRSIQDWLSDERASFVGRPLDMPPTAF